MSLHSDDDRWGAIAKLLHWLTAIGILGAGVVGLLMTGMKPSMDKTQIYALHKSVGLSLLALVSLRIVWRLIDRRPRELPAPRWQLLAARVTHLVLYLLILALPFSGWLFTSLKGYPLRWFDLFGVPALVDKNSDLAHAVHGVHENLFWCLLLVLVLHVAAALKHHVVEGDDVLRRMLPFVRPAFKE